MNLKKNLSYPFLSIVISLGIFLITKYIFSEVFGIIIMQYLSADNELFLMKLFDVGEKLISLLLAFPCFVMTIKKFNPLLNLQFFPKQKLSFIELFKFSLLIISFSGIFVLLPPLFFSNQNIPSIIHNTKYLMSDFIFLVILFPLMEELIFRNYIYQQLLSFDCRYAILISTLLFAFGHGNIINILMSIIPGIILTLIFDRSKGILYGYFVHSLSNFTIGVLLPLLLDILVPSYYIVIFIGFVLSFVIVLFDTLKRHLILSLS